MLKTILYSLFLIITSFFPFKSSVSYTLNAYDFTFQDIDGNVVTANVIGVEYKGKIYNLPSYDRRGGFFTPEELIKKYEVEMETGVIKGYDKNFDGPRENHPANVAARREHKLMQDEAALAREAVKYKDTPSKEIVSGLKAGMKALGL